MEKKASVLRITETGKRKATLLSHDSLRVMIDDIGGIVPELSGYRDGSWYNAHWQPWFRSHSGDPFDETRHKAFWRGDVMRHMAGNFPCIPTFGPGPVIDGVSIPPHGWTSHLEWRYITSGVEADGTAWALSRLESPGGAMPLSFSKIDALIPGQPVHYSSLRVKNKSPETIEICAAWHNTVGLPFLYPGCRISGAGKTWMTPPAGGEFDKTSRLVLGAEFGSLAEAPLLKGGKADISLIPVSNGFTDFASGAIPKDARTGWLSLSNPYLKMLYLSFFPGPAQAEEDDIILYFNELWMQYGGRPFTPWAPYDGGPDMTRCLGLENAVSAFAYGLEYSRKQKTLMGNPATFTIPAEGQKTMRSGTLMAPWEAGLEDGIQSLEAEEKRLVAKGKTDVFFAADPGFTALKSLEAKHQT